MSATAHAKFIICGEHFVMYRAKCIVVPTECFSTRVTLRNTSNKSTFPQAICRFDENIDITTAEIEIYQNHISKLLERLCKIACVPRSVLSGLECHVQSSIPPGQGAGSSSALSCALVQAFLEFIHRHDIGRQYIDFYSRQLENTWHGPVSGVDNIAVTRTCPVMFQIGEEPLQFLPDPELPPLYFVVGSTGPRVNPEAGFVSLKTLKKTEPVWFDRVIAESNAICETVMKAMAQSDARTIGECMASSQALLEQIGVSTPKIVEAIRAAKQAGAYGAKLTGAGCGGFVVAITPENRISRIQTAWQKCGLSSVKSFVCASR